MGTEARKGQALVEFVIGIFALSLVVSALFAFSRCIVASMTIERDLRAKAGREAMISIGGDGINYSSASDSRHVKMDELAAKTIFKHGDVTVRESVHMPAMGVMQ